MDATTYRTRRDGLRSLAKDGDVVLLLGNRMLPRNYTANVYPFRQSSHLLYFCGLARADLALVLKDGEEILFAPPEDIDDIVWHGPHQTIEEAAAEVGLEQVRDRSELGTFLSGVHGAGRKIHYLPLYHHRLLVEMGEILGLAPKEVAAGTSEALCERVAELRAHKSEAEVAEIENALGVTARMHVEAMRVTRPGIREAEVAAAIQRIALSEDRQQAYNPIVTVHGEVLHNNSYHNVLEEHQLLLNDSGAESPLCYASDITRTWPVRGRFDDRQRRIYEIVLDSQLQAIAACRPGQPYREVHLLASRVIAGGLAELGLMKGDPEQAVEAGAHALFFPHGLGHMIGLDVHDMEDIGEKIVGYAGQDRSETFGLSFLRMARPLEAGFVFTVEPGIYFIPALIDRWREEKKHEEFIAYDRLDEWRTFGGIRIEDDVLCTQDGHRVLGPGIPKTVEEVEAAMAS